MARFRFKLESVESVRRAREQEALRGLANAQRAFQAAVDRREAVHAKLQSALIEREQVASNGAMPRDLALAEIYVAGTKQRLLQSDHGIYKARKGIEKALRVYLQARRQTRAIEILREKAFADWKLEQRRREQKLLDDIVVSRAARRSAGMGGILEDSEDVA